MTISFGPVRLLQAAIALGFAAHAQDQPGIQFSSTIQANYLRSWSAATTADASLGFLKAPGQLRINEATLSLTGDWSRFGFRIDGGAGDFYKAAMSGDSWKGPNQYVSQAYLFAKPFADLPVRIEAGKFFSSVGAEVPQSYLDFNITRSLLFWYGSPLYHIGFRASLPITQSLTVGAQLLSGCNTIIGAHGHQSMAYTASRTGKRWGWSEIYVGGNQKPVGRGWRQLSDTVFTIRPSPKITAYAEFLAALERRVTPGFDRWFGWATAWKVSPREKWSVSPRLEWFNDPTGATTGMAQRLAEFTLTGEYRPVKFAVARLEYRNEWSNKPFYHRGDATMVDRRQTIVAGITLLLQHGL